MLKSASGDPKLSSTEFMKYVSGLAAGGSAEQWAEEFSQKVIKFFVMFANQTLCLRLLPLHITFTAFSYIC